MSSMIDADASVDAHPVPPPITLPTPPPGSCHSYQQRKQRFCRNPPLHNQLFCGNHRPEGESFHEMVVCHIDPTHKVRKDKLKGHLKVCTKGKQIRAVESQPFYRPNCNSGKRLCPLSPLSQPHDISSSIAFAQRVVTFYKSTVPEILKEDKSSSEEGMILPGRDSTEGSSSSSSSSSAFTAALKKHKVPAGRAHHIVQQGSMVGWLREYGLLRKERTTPKIQSVPPPKETLVCEPCAVVKLPPPKIKETFIELGAGRGMLGLIVSSVSAAEAESQSMVTELVMVERGSSRRSAETRIRNKVDDFSVVKPMEVEYAFNPNNIKHRRIRCDLLNLWMPEVVGEESPQSSAELSPPKVSILAKHLCGHASDLALRSLIPIKHTLKGLAFAMCCHGICRWDELVGREYIEDLCAGRGFEDFELLRKWGAGVKVVGVNGEEIEDEEHVSNREGSSTETSDSSFTGVAKVCQSPEFKALGISKNELSRISSRVIDYCRLMFVRNELGFGVGQEVENGSTSGSKMVYYCDQSITPQNLLVIASRREEERNVDGGGKRQKSNRIKGER